MGDIHFRVRWAQSEQGPVPKPRGKEEKEDFPPHFRANPSYFVNVSYSLDLPGQRGPHLYPKTSPPLNPFLPLWHQR